MQSDSQTDLSKAPVTVRYYTLKTLAVAQATLEAVGTLYVLKSNFRGT
jgi:hypothetical protein